jgi:hypothetical protein
MAEEERGQLEFRVITNDGDHQNLKWLIGMLCSSDACATLLCMACMVL